jgi:peroxiredoxin
MNKFKKLLICALSVCTVTCVGAALAACGNDNQGTKDSYPNIINPTTSVPGLGGGSSSNTTNSYILNIKSSGGIALNNVKVSIKKNGVNVVQGISQNGIITLNIDPDDYDVVFDESTLPDGYYIPEGQTYKLTANELTVDLAIPSTVIDTTAPSGYTYSLGNVMYDFGFTDTTGERSTLSGLLKTKKAVVLNFWYISCNPCRSEFPSINSAYELYKDDVAIVALSYQDSISSIKAYQEELGLNFYMAEDQAGLTTRFGVTAFPTTIIVDRYGVVAYSTVGALPSESAWISLFSKYTADDYVQDAVSDSGDDAELERVKPSNVEAPNLSAVASAINGTGTDGKVSDYHWEEGESDKEYSWPWLIKTNTANGNKYITASNAAKGYSFAIIYTTITLNSGDILSYDYKVNTESGNDIMYVLVDGEIAAEHSGDSNGWQNNYGVYVATRKTTIEFSIIYIKDQYNDVDDEEASIGNITIINASEAPEGIDVRTSAVSGIVGTDGKYTEYVEVELSSKDGYYHVVEYDKDGKKTLGAVLLADILNDSAWSDLRFNGAKTFENAEGSSKATSLYQLSFWQMSNYQEVSSEDDDSSAKTLIFKYGYSTTIIDNYYWQGFSDNDFIPVTEDLKNAMVAFTKQYCQDNDKVYYEDQWLEMCYYGIHYGGGDLSESTINDDPILGLNAHNAVEVYENTPFKVDITKIITYNRGGGLFFKFTPSKSGVYNVYATNASNGADPYIIVCDDSDLTSNASACVVETIAGDVRPGSIGKDDHDNSFGYVYMQAGKTYYLQCRNDTPGTTGSYTVNIKYVAEEYDFFRVATTGDGLWTWDEETGDLYYLAIETQVDEDGYYRQLITNSDGSTEYGSYIYIDFVNANYLDQNGHSLYEFILNGEFNFTQYSFDASDFTSTMLAYYYDSIDETKVSKDDPLYGMVLADDYLVQILTEYLSLSLSETKSTGYWKTFANYFVHYGPASK